MFNAPFSLLCDMLLIIICHTAVQFSLYTCTDNTTTEPQGTGRKRGRSDPEGVDSSEPGKCQLISAVLSPPSLTTIVFLST